ncbi:MULTISPECIES: hypothetical protein [unclassified Lacrimispora]|uniref:hypothetical protein n=1 Tax=unclassified Lacrimispora TaxID=2719232 RepID=UPI0037706C61
MSEVNRIIPIIFEKVQDYSVADTRFTKVKIKMMHLGLNLNNSIFNKEVVDEAIPTLCNTPILAYVEKNSDGDDDFSDHRQELSIEHGTIKVTYKCIPFGVIGESCNPRYENHTTEDGVERTYLVVDGLIWNKIEHTDIFTRDFIKDASMELTENYSGKFDEDNHFVFTKIEFDGICALGNNIEPAMKGANIEVNFALNEIQTKLEQFNTCINDKTPVTDNSKKGENNILDNDKIEGVLKEFSVKREDINFEITDTMTETELRDNLKSFKENNSSNEIEDGNAPKVYTSFSTYNEKRELLRSALKREEMRDGNGSLEYYLGFWIADFDDSYVYVEKEEYNGEEWSYEKGRFGYTVSESFVSVTTEFEPMIVKWLTAEEYATIEKMRSTYEAFEADKCELERLQKFEKDTLNDRRKADLKLLYEKFDEKLADCDEYKTLKESDTDFSVEDIEMKCFALIGKIATNFSTEKKSDVVKLDFEVSEKDTNTDDGYGGILASKYNK